MQHLTATCRTFGPVDLILICLLLAVSVAAYPLLDRSAPRTVRIYRDDAVVAVFPLEEPHTFAVDGAEGPLEVAIANGTVRVVHSTCRRGICVHSGAISRSGQQIVCAPNHVLIEIDAGSAPEQPDAVVR